MPHNQLVKSFYDTYWITRNSESNRYRYNIFMSWISDGSTILDIGCGDGYLGQLLQLKKNCDVTGLDISEVALEKAKAKGLRVIRANIEEPLPFKDNSFDYVIATEAIEHISLSEQLLKEMKRVSKCHLILSVPNIAFWKHRLRLLGGRFPKQWVLEPYEHLRFWSVSDFKEMTKSLSLNLEMTKAGSGRRYIRDLWLNLFAEQVCFKLSK